jgi:predicted nucleic acid-binding protein
MVRSHRRLWLNIARNLGVASKPVYFLDSFALLAYLNDEPGGARVQEVMKLAREHKVRLVMSYINFGEVLYITERHRGLPAAQVVQGLIESTPIELLDASRDIVLDAAHIKAQYPISYADAFAVAGAIREKAVILTGDPEFETVEQIIKIEWLNTQ